MYCPKCRNPLFFLGSIKVLMNLTGYVKTKFLEECPISIYEKTQDKIEEVGFLCKHCGNFYEKKDIPNILIKSMLTGSYFKAKDCIIAYIKCSEQDRESNLVSVIVPPRVIGITEEESFNGSCNPYGGDKQYLVINPLVIKLIDVEE